MMDDKILFAIGDQKEVYQQMLKNPNVEIVTLAKNGHWLRYSGVAVFEHEKKYVDKVFEMRPSLKRFYNEETNCHIVCFYLTRATCLDVSTFETTKIL